MKPGYKTTEFWGKNITLVAAFAATCGGALPGKYAVLAAVISEAAYAISRAITKFATAKYGEAVWVEEPQTLNSQPSSLN